MKLSTPAAGQQASRIARSVVCSTHSRSTVMAVFDKHLIKKLCYWISEREAVRQRKEAGNSKPWTADPLLQGFRWCNVRRMDDRVSKWLEDNWYTEPLAGMRPQGALVMAT